MVTMDRWQAAQRYERGFWGGVAHRIRTGAESQLEWYDWRAGELVRRLTDIGREDLCGGTADVVEVGCGPVGIAPFFPARAVVAVDPLSDYYASDEELSRLRRDTVSYRQGLGEALPCADGSCDLLIMENCIDHVRDVDAVIRELHRVLRPKGVLYMTVNARTPLGFLVHRVLSRARIDPGHPHTFTTRKAEAMISRHDFRMRRFEAGSYLRALREDLAGPGLRPRAKALLGTSEFVVTLLAER